MLWLKYIAERDSGRAPALLKKAHRSAELGRLGQPDAYELFILSLSRSYASGGKVNCDDKLNPKG